MTSCFARGLAACSLSLALLACSFEDDDKRASSSPPAPAPSATHGTASPSASATTTTPPPPAATGAASSPSSSPPSGGGAPGSCVPNAVCGGLDYCNDEHYACSSGQTGYMVCDCDGTATDPSAHLHCSIYC